MYVPSTKHSQQHKQLGVSSKNIAIKCTITAANKEKDPVRFFQDTVVLMQICVKVFVPSRWLLTNP